jgi:hypothetical protein
MNRTVQTTTVKVGQSADINGSGKFLKILRVFPPSLVVVQSDQQHNAVSGTQIEFDKAIHSAKLACTGAAVDVTVQYYIGDFPFSASVQTNADGSICTVDWISLDPVGGGYFVTLKGVMVLNGTTYRRKAITFVNLSAGAINVQATRNSLNAMVATGGGLHANGPKFPLTPANGLIMSPTGPFETDDDFIVSSPANSDISLLQTWIPVLP